MQKSFKVFFIVGVLGLCNSSFVFSQNVLTSLIQQGNQNAVGVLSSTFDNRYQGIRGTPYFLDSWVPGSLMIKKNNFGATEEVKNLLLKYDVHGNQIAAVIAESKDTLLVNASFISSFRLNLPGYDKSIEFRAIPEAHLVNPKLADAFFAVLFDGKTKFVKGVSKTFVPANFKGGYSAGISYDELAEETQYYFLSGGQMFKTKLNRKALLDAMPAQQEKLKSFISSQKLAMNTEADFIKVLGYLETL